jgi:ATP-dependent DNA helicase HFM1/MER3
MTRYNTDLQLSALSQAEEFVAFRFRQGEKSVYKELNKNPDIRFPIPSNLDLPAHKVSLILQAVLGGIEMPTKEGAGNIHSQYKTERYTIVQQTSRLIRCIADIQIHRKDAVSLRNALLLCRSLGAEGWDDLPLQMRQIGQIGIVSTRKLAAAGIKSIDDLDQAEAHKIEAALNKGPTVVHGILDAVKAFPKLRISMKEVSKLVRSRPL